MHARKIATCTHTNTHTGRERSERERVRETGALIHSRPHILTVTYIVYTRKIKTSYIIK